MEATPKAPPLPPSKLLVTYRAAIPKTRTSYCINSLATVEPYCFNNSIATTTVAVTERMFLTLQVDGFKAPPRPSSSAFFNDTLANFATRMDAHSILLEPCSYQTFINHFDSSRRKAYQRAYDSYAGNFPPIGQLSKVKIFTKFEKNFKPEATPRCINPRDIGFRIVHGAFSFPMDSPILHATSKASSKSGLRVVMKGLNQRDRGILLAKKWKRFKDPVCVLKDAHRMDQHVSIEALKYTHERYLKYYRGPARQSLAHILDRMLVNKFSAHCRDGSLRGVIHGGRMSGDNDTGTGNIILMVAMDTEYADHKGIPDYEIFNDGDDSGIIFEQEYLQQYLTDLPQWFLALGFSMEVEKPVFVLEEISFCQSQPVYDGDSYLMVRDPRKAIAKDAVSITPLRNEAEYNNWIRSVGVGGMTIAGQIPIWQEFYLAMSRAAPNARINPRLFDYGMKMKIANMRREYGPIAASTRHSFYLAFGIEPAKQELAETILRNLDLTYECNQLSNALSLLRHLF